MKEDQNFGGEWTQKKLNCLKKYLIAYQEALKNKSFFHKIYIDAFSGTGERCEKLEDGQIKFFEGSVSIALGLEKQFDEYFFIEKDLKKCQKLEALTLEKGVEDNVRICNSDANIKIPELCNKLASQNYNRGIIFLDPFACNVSWETIETIAKTKILDMWYLFPTGATLRTMPKRKGQLIKQKGWAKKLNYIFGTEDWQTLYQKNPQENLFGDDDQLREDMDEVEDFFHNRLKEVFPFVANSPMRLLNSKNTPLFSLFFAVSNPSPAAGKLALKIADNLLKG